jgi:hypothetical protein
MIHATSVMIATLTVMYIIAMWLLDVSIGRAIIGFMAIVLTAVGSAYAFERVRLGKIR